jgi:4-amino-4-deoxychorismate lyase
VSVWINGRRGTELDCRDRGLLYGDGVFETMLVREHRIRLADFHLQRLYASCRRLKLRGPEPLTLRRELWRLAAQRRDAVLKLIVTRGKGPRGYRPAQGERCTRIISLCPAPSPSSTLASAPVRVRVCTTPLSTNPSLAGMKTLNRLDCVLARAEWRDPRVWEGLMRDVEGNWVCGTMSNLFLKRGRELITPLLDRCGVAGVMRRWIMASAGAVQLRAIERRVSWEDLKSAEEVFMSNAIVGIRSVGTINWRSTAALRFAGSPVADRLRALLDAQ